MDLISTTNLYGTIYIIGNVRNGKVYIGKTTSDAIKRLNEHRYLLRRNIHPNKSMQNDYNELGNEVFDVQIIERPRLERLQEREKYWISYYERMTPDVLYNISR